MSAKVYYSSMVCNMNQSPLNKIKKLINKCGVTEIYGKSDITAVKLHFGEYGNTAFLRPIYLRPILETLNRIGAKPFLTDTNTLYVGMRTNSVDHLHNANLNGFGYSTLQTPIIIADGLKGELYTELNVPNGEIYKNAKIAAAIASADKLFVISHFKGHEMTGFGGAMKNLAMGCASRAGKNEMHSSVRPVVDPHLCTACGRCKMACDAGAITISKHASIGDKCVGCAMCISACPEHAIGTDFNVACDTLQQKIVEYAAAVHNHFKQVVYVNVLTSIVPACDCHGGNDAPLVHDLGFMASTDPVAVDKASYDLVCKTAGKDVFQASWPHLNPQDSFAHAKKIGFGNTEYELETVK